MNKIDKNNSLFEYINANCDYVDNSEQAEIEALNIDFGVLSGKELSFSEICNEDYEFEKEVYLKLREADKIE